MEYKKSFIDFVSLFFVLTLVFGIAIFSLILYNAYDENIKGGLNDALTASTPQDASANVTLILEQTSSGISKINPLFPLLLVGSIAYVLILALIARSHPAFFFVGLIVLAVALILAGIFSNVYEAIGETDSFEIANSEFSIIQLIMNNLPVTIFIIFISISVILYAFRTGPPQGGAY